MRVRVKEDMTGFFGGVMRQSGQEFTIKERLHSTETDENGDPVVISVKSQFSGKWMEKVSTSKKDEDKSSEPKEPAAMKVGELKAALTEAEIEIPDGAVKADLVVLLEDHLLSED